MADSSGVDCCRCCFSFILTSGFTALFLWLSLRASDPILSIQDFYVPALNKTLNSPTNPSIYFDLKLDNKNRDKGIYYDNSNLTFYYYGPNTSIPVGNYTVQGFYQGHQKHTSRNDVVEVSDVPWDEASGAVSDGSVVVFSVGLATAVRFKIVFWKTKINKLDLKANVEVNNQGQKVNNKGIRLKSGSEELCRCHGPRLGLLILSGLLVLVF